ncbi:hypothetical protein Amet_1577 [Alkaliphilus metalliredigens QYMF]|uniref:Uncharacterized protein n=1 Tax=Alkaliphilus metalliredigens (strain QYMF) TaxID=293826 RepID=A6TNI8_ALKMQ|nr:hypothetical protein [Alkaliphilus metalliredigens]ABR47756.1 hypothetical protein Amet_1577 [Alkaliphilus metalliredigens QYMF]
MSIRKRVILSIIGLISAFIMMGYSNHNTIPLLERILVPIEMGNSTFYYAMLIPVVVIYFSFKNIIIALNLEDRNLRMRAFILTILCIVGYSSMLGRSEKVYRSYANDLNAIYYHRGDANRLGLNGGEEVITVNGTIRLENLGDESQDFYIKLQVPAHFTEVMEESELMAIDQRTGESEKFSIDGKTEVVLRPYFIGTTAGEVRERSGGWGRSTRQFNFVIYNEAEEISFTEKYE